MLEVHEHQRFHENAGDKIAQPGRAIKTVVRGEVNHGSPATKLTTTAASGNVWRSRTVQKQQCMVAIDIPI